MVSKVHLTLKKNSNMIHFYF